VSHGVDEWVEGEERGVGRLKSGIILMRKSSDRRCAGANEKTKPKFLCGGEEKKPASDGHVISWLGFHVEKLRHDEMLVSC
jgi:hypothetical protein